METVAQKVDRLEEAMIELASSLRLLKKRWPVSLERCVHLNMR